MDDEWVQVATAAGIEGKIATIGEHREVYLLLDGVHCAACVWLIETGCDGCPGVVDVGINASVHRARVRFDPEKTDLADLLRGLAGIGYRAWPYDPAKREAMARGEVRGLLARMSVALLVMMQVMMFAAPAYITVDGVDRDSAALLRWASLLLTLPTVLYCAAPFFSGMWRDLRLRRVGMDVPLR